MLSQEDRNSNPMHYRGMRYLHLSEFYSRIVGYEHISRHYFSEGWILLTGNPGQQTNGILPPAAAETR